MSVTRQRWFKTVGNRQLLAGLLVALFLSVFTLAQSEALHRHFHADAGQPNHQCAVTMLQSGQVDAPVCDAAIVPSAVVSVSVQLVENTFVPSVAFFLPPSCGPPAILS